MKIYPFFALCGAIFAGCASMGLPLDTDADLARIQKGLGDRSVAIDNTKQIRSAVEEFDKQSTNGKCNHLGYYGVDKESTAQKIHKINGMGVNNCGATYHTITINLQHGRAKNITVNKRTLLSGDKILTPKSDGNWTVELRP